MVSILARVNLFVRVALHAFDIHHAFTLYHRTSPFNIDEMGKMYVTILRSDGEVELIRVHVMMEVATVFIVLNKEEGRWPYRIDNRSSWDVSFCQHVSASVFFFSNIY